MILRKPYAFIIKHFRLIHLFLLLPFAYYTFYLFDLYKFFGSLQKSNTHVYAGATNYIDSSVIPLLLFGLFFTVVMYFTFKEKKKPNRLYLGMFAYYLAIFIISKVTNSNLNTMVEKPISSEWIMICKELNLLLFLPTLFFDAECFLRGIGFNIKKFNFNKDIAELNIADEDSEEFEVLIGQNNYKYFRFFRRTKRELGYYIKENKLAISIVGGVIALVLALVGFYYYNAYLKRIKASESSIVDFIGYTVNDCYMTAEDFNGNKILDGYKFVVIDLTLYNSSTKPRKLETEKLVLSDGELEYYPTFIHNGKFYDLGLPYERNQLLPAQQSTDATLTYTIPDTVTTTDFTFKVQYNLGGNGINVIADYKKFKVKVRKLDSEAVVYNINMNNYFNTDVAGRNEFSLNVKNYAFRDTYSDNYVKCTAIDKCVINQEVVSTINYSSNTMLILDYSAIIGKDNNFVKQFNTYSKIFENYGYMEYIVYGVQYKEKINTVPNSDIDGKIFVSMPRRILDATRINLVFYFRNYRYIITLK